MRLWIFAAALALLAACSPATAPTTIATPSPQPSAALASAFPNCAWQETRGAGASVWGFACAGDSLVVDEQLPGFVRQTSTGDGSTNRWPVVRFFDIAQGAPLDSILAQVRAVSPADDISSCSFSAVEGHEGWFQLMPTGALLDRYNAFIAGQADGPSMPCGALGPSESGARYFFRLPGSETKVAFIDPGGDLPPTDFTTLRAAD